MTRESHFSPEESNTRERILEAAMRLFSENGYGATPIKAIARACGISDAGVFHHFRSKHNILEALWDQPNTRGLQTAAGDPVSDDDTLRRLILQNLDAAAENAQLHRLLIRQQLDGDRYASQSRARAEAGWRESLRAWFVLYEPADTNVMIDAFMNAILGIVFIAEVEYGSKGFQDIVVSQEFRSQAVQIVSRAVALDRFQKAGRAGSHGEAQASS